MSESSKSTGLKIERTMGLAVSGLFCGLLVGTLLFSQTGPDAPSDESQSPQAVTPAEPGSEETSASLEPAAVVASDDVAEETVRELSVEEELAGLEDETPDDEAATEGDVSGEQPAAGMSDALSVAVREAESWRSVRMRMHRTLGTGAFAGPSGLTLIGRTIAERAATVGDHALDPTPYQVFDLPGKIEEAESGEEGALAALEAALGRALVHLVLDYRLVKRAGPFELRKMSTLERRPTGRRAALRLALEFARAQTAEQALAVLDPPHHNYAHLVRSLARYREYAANANCPELPLDWQLRPGVNGPRVRKLQERLRCEGWYEGPIHGEYDDAVLRAVQAYQRTHELEPDGLVYRQSLRSMNVSMARRLAQIELALQRLRESKVREMGDFYLAVNIPSFQVRAVDNGEVTLRHKVIVGTNRLDDNKLELVQGHLNRTKLFTTELYKVIVNPAWILPERVAKGELVGKLQEDPDYLEKHNIRRRTLPNGREVLIQGFGAGNVLGRVKFLLRRSNAIFLHDTDKPLLFRERRRDFSHGCVRVHKAVNFAHWILLRDGYEQEEIDRAFALEETQRGMDLRQPISLMTEYITVDVDEAGLPVFLTDIYGYDRAYREGNLPPVSEVRWGDFRLRPNWVPQVPEAVVSRWRRAGKAAPRNYDPSVHGGN